MNKLLLAALVAALGASACASGNTKTADGRKVSAKDAKYQIIDQEFDNLLAPDADYDTLPGYELQACGDSYLPPADASLKGAAKPAAKKASAKKTAAKKTTTSASKNTATNTKVVNNTTVYYLDGAAAPTTSSSSTQTTTYSSEEALPPADMPDTL